VCVCGFFNKQARGRGKEGRQASTPTQRNIDVMLGRDLSHPWNNIIIIIIIIIIIA